MTLGDALTIGLVLLALWVFVVERYTTLRLEDGVRLGADAVRAAWRRVAPLVRWVAYDVIVGRESVKDEAEPAPDVLSSGREQQNANTPQTPQTDGSDADRRPKPTEAEFLTLFVALKEAGYNRDEARAILRPFGVPVDNNLYTKAKPAPTHPMGDPSIVVGAAEPPPR